jgi:hypothetical protein
MLQLGYYSLKTQMFSIYMGGFYIVLGTEWLRTLGPITMDFNELYMSLQQEGHCHTFKDITVGSFFKPPPYSFNKKTSRKALSISSPTAVASHLLSFVRSFISC